jgi:diaminohydroxyphosphoribosylaminopyrimidine deaminase/5-amino-6-(5-phosphoribosylamino)uracil reductase
MSSTVHEQFMGLAIAEAERARRRTAPNPWVGCVVVDRQGNTFSGSTEPPGGRHAEIVAMDVALNAGADLGGATLYTTLEPCNHRGRTGPCTDAIIAAGVAHVVVGTRDPDTKVAGRGITALRTAGIQVAEDVEGARVRAQLAPYLHHRRTGRPFVVLKVAATLDGRVAAEDGTSRWITSEAARVRVHELRADSQAICTGAGTVRSDDPELTVRHADGPNPRRVVLGTAPAEARVRPCLEWNGSLPDLLDQLGAEGVLQLLVEAGPSVAGSFHREGLVNRYVVHLAPAIVGSCSPGMFAGVSTNTISDLWRGRITATTMLGPDLEVVLEP